MPGLPSQFGPYQILGPLGAGGMGQVYRARDTRLRRLVAIKTLHDADGHDPDRHRRFTQEAVSASALNHPNILTVYDVGVSDGVQYLVSELVEGESLRAEMNRGRVPLKRAIEIAHQVAEGLAAAHDAAIVHRDVKPENIMVTSDGRVKIVDFGLAVGGDGPAASDGGLTATQTASGLIVGTVPYMSPEQARGGHADFRSDQFALGLILYELTTGDHPFQRETPVQTLSAIIADEPLDPAQATPSLPVAVRWLIRRLLAKNPRQRFASTADLAADLRTIREYLSEATSGAVMPLAAPPPRWRMPAAAAAVMAAVGVLAARAPADPGLRFEKFTPFATDAGYQGAPTWSPDGTAIAYEAEVDGVVQIFTRTVGSSMRTKVTDSRFDCYLSTWSPDGNIYYHSLARDVDALWRVSPVGGAKPEVVIENAAQSAVSPDGKTVFFLRGSLMKDSLWFASLPDGVPAPYARGALKDRTGTGGYLRFSPDGSKLMVWLGPDGRKGAGFWEIVLPDGEPRPLLETLDRTGLAPAFFSWMPDNRHLVLTRSDGPTPGTHLWVADTEPASVASKLGLTNASALVPLTPTPGNESAPSVSPDGRTIAFTWEATDFDLFEVPLDGSSLRPFLSSTRNEYDPAVSPVNTQYALVTDRTGNPQIWLQNQEGYFQQPLVTDADFAGSSSMAIGSLAFSPDGTKLAFQRASGTPGDVRVAGSRLWVKAIAGGKPYPIGGDESYQDAPTWSPDGRWIAYLSSQNGELGLAKTEVGGRGNPVVLINSGIPPFVARPQWSPDGQWILCETQEGLTIVAPDGTSTRVVGDAGWFGYAWDKDGRRIYGLRPSDDQHHIMLVSLDVKTGTQRVNNPNLGTIPHALQPIRGFSFLNGRGFLTSVARVKSDIYLIEGFRLPSTWWRRLSSAAPALGR